jgi:hypothetical protein
MDCSMSIIQSERNNKLNISDSNSSDTVLSVSNYVEGSQVDNKFI